MRGGCCAGPATGRVPGVSAPTPSPGPREESPGRRSGTAEGRLRKAARASEHRTPRLSGGQRRQPGTRTGRGTHRAGGGGGAGRRGAGRVLPPQAGLEALHGQVFAARLPAAQRARAAREPSSVRAASARVGGGGGAGDPGPTCHLGAPGCPPGLRRGSPPAANPAAALEGVGPEPTNRNPGRGRDFPFKLNNTLPFPAGGKVWNFSCASAGGERPRQGRTGDPGSRPPVPAYFNDGVSALKRAWGPSKTRSRLGRTHPPPTHVLFPKLSSLPFPWSQEGHTAFNFPSIRRYFTTQILVPGNNNTHQNSGNK